MSKQTDDEELRKICVDLYYKGFHEGKGDIPNSDDIEITNAQQAIRRYAQKMVVTELKKFGGNTVHAQFCRKKGEQFKKCMQCLKDDRITTMEREIDNA